MKSETKGQRVRQRRRLGAALVSIGALLGSTLAMPSAGAVEPGDEVHIGTERVGYGGSAMFAVFSDGASSGTPDFWAYCLEQSITSRTNITGHVGDVDDFLGDNYFNDADVQARVRWVLAHSYPAVSLDDLATAAGIATLDENDAVEATQYAIWRYTDLTSDAPWSWETADSEAVYWYLVNGANASTGLSAADMEVTVSVTGPSGTASAESLIGPFTVNTNQAVASVTVDPVMDITDATGAPIDTAAVVDGQEIYLDQRSSTSGGTATVTATVAGKSGTGLIVSVPESGTELLTPDNHAQTIVLVAPGTATTSDSASVTWDGSASSGPTPSIRTSLVDAADGDRVLPSSGGTVVDTVAYEGLTPGTEYTLTGQLMRKSDGTATGITGTTTFTATDADGSIDVIMNVPEGYAGQDLVAFEQLYEGTNTSGTPIAVHEDINDAAQTITVEEEEEVIAATPMIWTSLVDPADGDRLLPWNGGRVVDTVYYRNLIPGTEYTVTGQLMRKSDGTATGITGTTTFTATEADGSIDVIMNVPEGYAGQDLVAFEQLYEGTNTSGTPIAVHEDINDPAQTISIRTRTVPTDQSNNQQSTNSGSTNGGRTLARTGTSLTIGLAGLAIVSIAGGTTLVTMSRRRAS